MSKSVYLICGNFKVLNCTFFKKQKGINLYNLNCSISGIKYCTIFVNCTIFFDLKCSVLDISILLIQNVQTIHFLNLNLYYVVYFKLQLHCLIYKLKSNYHNFWVSGEMVFLLLELYLEWLCNLFFLQRLKQVYTGSVIYFFFNYELDNIYLWIAKQKYNN